MRNAKLDYIKSEVKQFVRSAIIGIIIGSLILIALWRLQEAIRVAPPPEEVKKAFLEAARIEELHHEVYQQVGEKMWETARDEILSILTRRTVQATGNPAPSIEEVAKWTRENPKEAQEIFRSIAEKYKLLPPQK